MTQAPSEDSKPITDLLSLWLSPSEDAVVPSLWLRRSAAQDARLAARFGALHAEAVAGPWPVSVRAGVARVIALDQLSRSIGRGTAAMFAHDDTAGDLAEALLADAEALPPAWRAALALCLAHAEDVARVRRGLAHLTALQQDPRTRRGRKSYRRLRSAARKQQRVLDRFGRDPHRSALLGRESTPDELAAIAAAAPRPPKPVRVGRLKLLVLHPFRQSGAQLRRRTRALEAAIGDLAELVFLDAPNAYVPDAEARAVLEADFGEVPDFSSQRCWWNSDADGKRYTGWEDSLRSLEAHLPADGVLGLSQGAAMAGLLAALKPTQLRLVVCAAGFPARDPAHDMLMRPASIDVPSLHLFGERDALVDHDRTMALAGCFVDAEVSGYPGGHFAPSRWPMDRLRAFLLRFTDAPTPPQQLLTAPDWIALLAEPDPTDQAITALLPADRSALRALLREAAGLRGAARYAAASSITAPQPGDIAHRIWAAVWAKDPELVREEIADESDWAGLVRLAVLTPGLRGLVADRLAAQLQADEGAARPSTAAEAAPRVGSAVDRCTRLGREIAARLRPSVEAPKVYMSYRRQIVALSRRSKALRQPRRRPRGYEAPAGAPLSPEIIRPRPVPVVPCPLPELAPLLAHLETKQHVSGERAFPRGTVTPDGRLDLCKQVVGPAGITPLLASLRSHPQVDRLLLGNNVIGSTGAAAVADFIRSGKSRLKVWYIAGNELRAEDLGLIAGALAAAPQVEGLWLKRNPLGPEAGPILAALLRSHPRLATLDLVNTGLLDEGALPVIAAAAESPALRHLYLGTNGLSPRAAAALGRLLAESDQLQSLYVSCNRLGDDGVRLLSAGLRKNRGLQRLGLASNRIGPAGARVLAEALRGHPTLRFLDLGWTRATSAVGEAGNRIGDEGAAAIGELLRSGGVLEGLDISHNRISQVGLDHISDALKVNERLTWLRCPQLGRASNPDANARMRGQVTRNRRLHALDEASAEEVRAPEAARAILSVYRTQPMP